MTRYVKLTPNVSLISSQQWECFLTTALLSNLIMKIAGKLQTTQVTVTFHPLSKRDKSSRTHRNLSYSTKKRSQSAKLQVSSIGIPKSKFKYIATSSNLITLVEAFHHQTRFQILTLTKELSRSSCKKEDFTITRCLTRKYLRFSWLAVWIMPKPILRLKLERL